MTKTDIARKYRDEYGMEMPTLKLARIMYKKESLSFKDVDDARYYIRRIEGKAGRQYKPTHPTEDRPRNPYNLPSSDEREFLPFRITAKRVAILSDIHVPYHSIQALTSAFDYLKKQKPDAILLNGDTIDCHRLSRFVKEPKSRDFKGELDTFKALIEVIKKEFGAKIYFKIGNHEARYQHFLMEKAHELAGIEEFDFENILKARAEGIELIQDKQVIKIGALNGIHGHEYPGGIAAPVNPARGLFMRGKVSCFQGHNHQTSEHTEPTMDGHMITTWSIGCLSELHPPYMPLNKWNHGFAVVDVDGDSFEFHNKRIYKGRVL